MRPLSITLDGFRSHVQRSAFDFRDQRLVGIVGPIGSGKSSILDAVAFALYGMTPTERSNTKSLIHQRADAARVELVFEVDGQLWRAVRALRRNGQSEHALYRYESDATFLQGSDPVETVLKKGEVDQRIVQLLGLDFAAFNRSVLLAQGRFAELLQATATQRDEVLKGVFGFDRIGVMERLAKLRRDTAMRDLEELGRERENLAETRRRFEQAQTESARAKTRFEQLTAIEPAVETHAAEAVEALRRREKAKARLAELSDLAERMPNPDDTAATLAAASETLVAQADLVAAAKTAREEAQSATEAVTELLAEVGGEEALAEATAVVSSIGALRDAHDRARVRVDKARADLDVQTKDLDEARQRLTEATAADVAATEQLERAEAGERLAGEAHHAAEHSNMAATLRAGLETGGSCPVCAQTVVELPDRPTVDLTVTERALDAARLDVRQAGSTARAAAQQLAAGAKEIESKEGIIRQTAETIEMLDGEATSTASLVEEAQTVATRLLGQGDPAVLLRARQTALVEARTSSDRASREADELQRRLDAARRQSEEVGQALDTLSAKLHSIAGRLGEELVIGAGPEEVDAALAEVRDRWAAAQRTASEARVRAHEAYEEAGLSTDQVLASIGLAAGADFGEARASAQAALAASTAELEVHRERIEASASLAERLVEAETRVALYKNLAAELTPSRFLNFLLREERGILSDLGSDRFEELTGGRFRFSDDGEFDVVDLTAAEQVRKADSLSGGETFLASLALALALAEMVTRGGGRLDAFFLDEGFGSLDSEHLDLAMAGIERLVADREDRLVVIVSHVPEMRQRLESLIVLDKDPVTGSTVVKSAPGAAHSSLVQHAQATMP